MSALASLAVFYLVSLASLQIGADAAGLHQYKGELVVSMKYIPSSKHPGTGNGRKGECRSSRISASPAGPARGQASWVWVGSLGGTTAVFSSAMPARLLWVGAVLAVLRLAERSQCFPGAGPGWTIGPRVKQLSAFASAGRTSTGGGKRRY